MVDSETAMPDSGGSASPSEGASSPTPASSPSGPSGATDNIFEGLGQDHDDDFTFEIDGSTKPEGASEAAQTLATEAESAVPSTTPPVEAQPSTGTQQPPVGQEPAGQVTQQPAPPAAEPQSFMEQLGQHRQDILAALQEERFNLSKDEEAEFDMNPTLGARKMASRVYYEAVTATLNHINNLVPHMIHQFLRVQKQNDEVEGAFYKQFGALDRAKHSDDVMQFAKSFRQANRQITQQDLFAMVGAAVMAKHRLSLGALQNGSSPQPAFGQSKPFVPASAGASVKVTPEYNPWEGLGQDHDD